MEVFFIKLLQLILALSILILLHEGGHFVFAKLFGIRVEKFYLFFDWKFSLFKFKPKKSDTEYGIGWLPLGGYCKIAGMIDESFDTEQMKQPVQPWEFRSKLLALLIYSHILFWWGDSYVPVKDMTMGMKFNQEAKALGFQDGDILVGTEKHAFKNFSADLYRDISEAKRVDIIRNGEPMSIQMPGDLNMLNMIKAQPSFVQMLIPNEVDSVLPGSTAEKMGLKKGCRILAIDGNKINSHNELIDQMARHSDMLTIAKTSADSLKARTVAVTYTNGTQQYTAHVVMHATLKLGFVPKAPNYEPVTLKYGFFESFPAGIKYGLNVLTSYIDDLKYVFTAEGAKSLGGFGTIGNLFPADWNWLVFWQMTAFLSIILAFMNILPIPALDGGHVLFLLYEMITRRKPSEQFMIRAEYVGFGIVLLLLVVANLNDILRTLGIM